MISNNKTSGIGGGGNQINYDFNAYLAAKNHIQDLDLKTYKFNWLEINVLRVYRIKPLEYCSFLNIFKMYCIVL